MKKLCLVFLLASQLITMPVLAESNDQLVSIEEENTYQGANMNQKEIQANQYVSKMLKDNEQNIENTFLLKLLNKSTWNTSPFAFGYEANVYLGRWPLQYTSEASTIYPQFQTINKNERKGKAKSVYYQQLEEKNVQGALTKKVEHADQIKKMILRKTIENQSLPVASQVTIGKDTMLSKTYSNSGVLKAHLPAVKESGHVEMGDVYLKMDGSKTELVISNVTKKEVGAFLPIVDHLSFTFETT